MYGDDGQETGQVQSDKPDHTETGHTQVTRSKRVAQHEHCNTQVMFKCALSLSKDPKSMDNYNSCDQLVMHTVIQSSAMLLSVSAKLDHGFHQ